MNTDVSTSAPVRTKKRFLVLFLSLLLAFLIPFIAISVITFAVPMYNKTFVGELGDKYKLLTSTNDEKIVVVGGSSVAFGLDSTLMEEKLGKKVVNFGLYADLGTKLMLDLSRANINEGDTVIVAPEMNKQTLSLFFNAETALQAMDGSFGMLQYVDGDDREALVGELWGFSAKKLGFLLSGSTPQNEGAYKKEWFNSNGDNTFDRPYNVMSSVSKTITLDFIYDKDDGVSTEYEEFIDYLNEYIEFCNDKGATVYFSFPPMNEASLTDYNTAETIDAFYQNLSASLNCRVISDVNDYIMDKGYFYDSEFHLNNSGVPVRTVRLIDDLKREWGRSDVTLNAGELPKPSGYQPIEFGGEDEENLYFILEAGVNGAGQDVWYVVGLNEEGKKQVSLKIPSNTDGKPITTIREGALEGAAVRTLVLGENISRLDSGSLGGAPHLKAVYLAHPAPAAVSVPNLADENGLATKGAPSEIKIYVPKGRIERFLNDYFWMAYADKLGEY